MKNKIKILICSLSTLLIVFFIIAFFYLIKKYSYSNNYLNSNKYFKISSEDDIAICLNDSLCDEKGLIKNNSYYLPYKFVINNLNNKFYYDNESNALCYTIPNQIIYYYDNALSFYNSDKKINTSYPLFFLDNNTGYISCDLISEYTNISYEVFNNPNRIQIYSKINDINRVKVKKNTRIRITGGVKSDILVDVSKGEKLDLIEKDTKWSKVHTSDGFTGYIRTKRISKNFTENITTNYKSLTYPSIVNDSNIVLGFDQTLNEVSNNSVQDRIENTNINVLCPTWFYLNDIYGNLSDNVSKTYIDNAHEFGIDVWPIINDFDGQSINGGINSSDETLLLLQSKNARTNIINQIIASYDMYHFDGINIDFENVSEECSTHYLQFIRELSIATHKLNIILSVDNYVPTYSKHYNRKEEATFCDYLILMGYDEYGSHSDSPGPNSSYNFVEQGIIDTLEEVPKEKLILALPFYSKIWYCNKDGSFYTDSIDMASAISRKDYYEVIYKEDVGYNYVEYEKEENTIKLWIEDDKSLGLKKTLINKYNLHGVAYWKLGLEIPSYWNEKE